jgi:nondiscriminating glutamyl-tRNA synthetase
MTQIRVRFAPSPTGFVHVGSLRTALFNYLFARHHQGQFILRIEDTDQERYVEGAVDNLLQALDWVGIDYDEGPNKDGPFGPYFQSLRVDIYKKHVQQLLNSEKAYPCFCSAERLENMRQEQLARGEDPKYDGHCRNIASTQARQRMTNESHVIRMKIPDAQPVEVDDLVRGSVVFQSAVLDDQILLKSDGFPTYHLANVVDDHLMEISHVIRGEEWLPSTPKHVLLYEAFGWQKPQFAHLPLLLNADRSKLSKRQGDVAVEDYQKRGILPQALLNFVALLGWNKGDDQEIFTMEELIRYFSLERINKSGAVFDIQKLLWMNGQYIRNLMEDDYLEQALSWLKLHNLDSGNDEKNKTIVLAVRNHLNQFSDIKEASHVFFEQELQYTGDARQWIKGEEGMKILTLLKESIQNQDELSTDNFKKVMREVQTQAGIKGKELWMPVRAAITGDTAGPELAIVLNVIGKERVLKFINQALNQ